MNLIDPRMMDRFVLPPIPPIIKQLSTLDNDMKSILDRDDISPENKVIQYNQILNRYLHYYGTPETLQQSSPISIPQTTTTTSSSKTDDVLEKEFENIIPPSFQGKAKALLQHIQQIPNISWNDKR